MMLPYSQNVSRRNLNNNSLILCSCVIVSVFVCFCVGQRSHSTSMFFIDNLLFIKPFDKYLLQWFFIKEYILKTKFFSSSFFSAGFHILLPKIEPSAYCISTIINTAHCKH